MQNKKLTEAQAKVLQAMSAYDGYVEPSDLVVPTGRTKRSIVGILNRLLPGKYVSKKKSGEYKLLKKGKVELVALETYSRMDTLLKGMTVSEIDDLHDRSIVHLTGLLLQAKKLPAKAITQLSKLVDKYGEKKTPESEVGLSIWPEAPEDLYLKYLNGFDSLEDDKLESRITGFAEVDLDTKGGKPDFCRGRLFVNSKHANTEEFNQLRYYGAFNFLSQNPVGPNGEKELGGPALDKLEKMRKDGKGLNNRKIFFVGRVNYLKAYGTTCNPTIHVYDFKVVDG